MTPEKAHRLRQLVDQLAEAQTTAAICAEEIRAAVHAELGENGAKGGTNRIDARGFRLSGVNGRPLTDASTLSIMWAGNTCHLGAGLMFRLADRLSRRPNQYVSYQQLLNDVWRGEVHSPATIRSAIRSLKKRLSDGGMGDLARAIKGRERSYILMLDDEV